MAASLRQPRPLPIRWGPDLLAEGTLYPSQSDILETEVTTAVCVAEVMFGEGLTQVERARHPRLD